MISEEFDFHAPKELADVFRLLDQYGDGARLLAGGMSLVPMMTLGLVRPQAIVSLNHVAGLDYVVEDKGALRIGAMTRHKTIAANPLIRQYYPMLAEAASYVGDVQVRNRGTVGGSISHADPAADYLPVMLVAGTRMVVQSSRGKRTIEARDFFTGLMETATTQDELLVEVVVPKLSAVGCSYQRLHRVEGSFPIVNAAATIEKSRKKGNLAIGGATPIPALLDLAPHLSNGVDENAIAAIGDAAYAATSDASEDINGSAEYRRQMAKVYARRAVKFAAAAL